MPMIALQSVVLPMPLRPITAADPPASSKETSSRARAVPYHASRFSTARSGSDIRLVAPTEIQVVHGLVCADLVGRAFHDHAAVVHHRHPFRAPEPDAQVVL